MKCIFLNNVGVNAANESRWWCISNTTSRIIVVRGWKSSNLEYTLENEIKNTHLKMKFSSYNNSIEDVNGSALIGKRAGSFTIQHEEVICCVCIGFENAMKYVRDFHYHIVNCASFMANILEDVIARKMNENQWWTFRPGIQNSIIYYASIWNFASNAKRDISKDCASRRINIDMYINGS